MSRRAKLPAAVPPIVTDEATMPGVRILVGESTATRALGLTNDKFAHQEHLVRFLPGTLVLMGKDRRVNYCRNVAFRSAEGARLLQSGRRHLFPRRS
jgi:hypothetical protein